MNEVYWINLVGIQRWTAQQLMHAVREANTKDKEK